MALLSPGTFTRRPGAHGTTESSCARCSLIVATAKRKEDLDQVEQRHVCDPWLLEQWKQMFERSPDRQEAGRFSFTPSQSLSPAQVSDGSRLGHAQKPPARPRPGNLSIAEFRHRTFTAKSKSA